MSRRCPVCDHPMEVVEDVAADAYDVPSQPHWECLCGHTEPKGGEDEPADSEGGGP